MKTSALPPKKKPKPKASASADKNDGEVAVMKRILGVKKEHSADAGHHLLYLVEWEDGTNSYHGEESFAGDKTVISDLAKRFDFSGTRAAAAAVEDLASLGRTKTLGQQIDSHVRALEKQIQNLKNSKPSVKPNVASVLADFKTLSREDKVAVMEKAPKCL